MNNFYLDAIRKFEGFTQRAEWDYAQHTNGYGTRALFPGEVIDRAEADRRFEAEIGEARAIVERNVPQADEGTKAALTSLTFNAGDKWTRSGLGEALRQGDSEAARELFLQYSKAGGQTLPGLVARRIAEAEWIGNPQGSSNAVLPAEMHAEVLDVPPSAGVSTDRLLPGRTTASEVAAPHYAGDWLDRGSVPSDRSIGSMAHMAVQAPEQRFAQQASIFLMLLQLKEVPLLTTRSQASNEGDRNEPRHASQDTRIVRT